MMFTSRNPFFFRIFKSPFLGAREMDEAPPWHRSPHGEWGQREVEGVRGRGISAGKWLPHLLLQEEARWNSKRFYHSDRLICLLICWGAIVSKISFREWVMSFLVLWEISWDMYWIINSLETNSKGSKVHSTPKKHDSPRAILSALFPFTQTLFPRTPRIPFCSTLASMAVNPCSGCWPWSWGLTSPGGTTGAPASSRWSPKGTRLDIVDVQNLCPHPYCIFS